MSQIKSDKSNKKDWNIQDYLSLGYIYLLILGTLRSVIYYSFIGINILNYSDLMDILLSPISFFGENPKIIVILFIVALLAYFYIKFMPKLLEKLKFKKNKKSNFTEIKVTSIEFSERQVLSSFIVFFIASFFIGTGIGSGVKKSKILKSKDFKISHKITFNNDKLLNVKMFGQNGSFIFYALKNTDKIIVSPIQNNITKIEKLDE